MGRRENRRHENKEWDTLRRFDYDSVVVFFNEEDYITVVKLLLNFRLELKELAKNSTSQPKESLKNE